MPSTSRSSVLRISVLFVICVYGSCSFAVSQQPAAVEPFDVVILNGHIIDGSGNPWYSADIGIRGDRIAAIGNLWAATATRSIDAHGLVVSPGFIDMLGQSETALLIDNRAISKLSQGITSEITGEGGVNRSAECQDACATGSGPGTLSPEDRFH